MNFDLSETQELFRDTTERFARNVDVAEREKIRLLEGSYDKARWSELSELGLLSIAITEDQGGLGGTIGDLSIIAESFGKENGLDPWIENGALPSLLLSKANKTDILDSIVEGSKVAALAFSEPYSRYDIEPHDTRAVNSDDSNGYVINGQKEFILGGAIADYILVTAKHDDEFGLFCLTANDPNIMTKTYRLADGSQATTIKLNQVHVEENAKLDLTFNQFKTILDRTSLLACAEMVGLSQLLLNETLAYVKERKQFGVAIGSFQIIQHGLVDCYSQLELMRSLLYRAILVADDGSEDLHTTVMGTKFFISDGADFIARQAVQYHGAMGITDELLVGHAFKRIILLSRLFGDSTHNLKEYAAA